MGLLFQIEGATRLDEGVWKVRLSPSELRLLDPRAESAGPVTVVLLSEEPRFDLESKSLAFDPSTVKLLNAGTSYTAIFVGGAPSNPEQTGRKNDTPAPVGSGDAKFRTSLPPHLQELGEKLLNAVRSKYPGDLVYYEASGKYVEAPDNFWTVRPQPRDESFRITVRGRPESFQAGGTLDIKPDMGSYSSFKVERADQVEELLSVLNQVRRK